MSDTIARLNLFAAGWAGAIGRACWQGGVAIAIVWALCRLFPRLSGRIQCWLWRLAYLKLLVALLWALPLPLPLLPPGPPALTAPPRRPSGLHPMLYHPAGPAAIVSRSTREAHSTSSPLP